MKTADLPPHLTVAKPAWGVLIWVKGEPSLVEAFASNARALAAAANYDKVPGQSAQIVPIQWSVVRRG